VSYQPVPPTFQQASPITTVQSGPAQMSWQPVPPLQVIGQPITTVVNQAQSQSTYAVLGATPAPIAQAQVFNQAGASFNFASLGAVATPAPIPQYATQSGQVSFQPQPPIQVSVPVFNPVTTPGTPIQVAQPPIAIPVPRTVTQSNPGCQPTTCQVPVCVAYSCDFQEVGQCPQCGCAQQSRTRVAQCYQIAGNNVATRQPVASNLCGASCVSSQLACPSIQPCLSYSCSAPTFDPTCYSQSGAAIAVNVVGGQRCCSAGAVGAAGIRRRAQPVPSQFQCHTDPTQFQARVNAFLQCAKQASNPSTNPNAASILCNCWTADPIPSSQYGNFWYCVNQAECAGLAGPGQDIYSWLLTNLALSTYWGNEAIAFAQTGPALRSKLQNCPGAQPPNCGNACTGVQRSTSQCLSYNQCGGSVAQPAASSNCPGGCPGTTTPCTVPICVTYKCSYQTVGVCQGTCGQSGQQTRTATCTIEGTGQVVATSQCGPQCTNSIIPCPALPCCAVFSCQVSPFSGCSSSCGDGQRVAAATCVQTCGGVQSAVSPASCQSAGVSCQTQTAPCTVCPTVPGPRLPGVAATIVGAPVTVQGAPVTVQGAPVYVQGAPVTVQGAPVTVQGAPVYVQGAPVTVQGAPVTVQGAPVYVQGATVTQVGQPVYVQGQPTYIQGTAVPVAPEIRFVPYYTTPSPSFPVYTYTTPSPSSFPGYTMTTTTTVSRYTRDSRGFCLDSQNNFQQVASTLCPIRRSQRSVAASQAIPYVAVLTVCGGIMVVVALVASVVVLARRTISKRLEMRFREHGLEMRS